MTEKYEIDIIMYFVNDESHYVTLECENEQEMKQKTQKLYQILKEMLNIGVINKFQISQEKIIEEKEEEK